MAFPRSRLFLHLRLVFRFLPQRFADGLHPPGNDFFVESQDFDFGGVVGAELALVLADFVLEMKADDEGSDFPPSAPIDRRPQFFRADRKSVV